MKITFIRVFLTIAVLNDLKIYQIYVKTMFPNGELEKETYIEQQEEFVVPR